MIHHAALCQREQKKIVDKAQRETLQRSLRSRERRVVRMMGIGLFARLPDRVALSLQAGPPPSCPLMRLTSIVRFLWLHFALLCSGTGAFAHVSDFSEGWRFHFGEVAGAEAPRFVDADWALVTAPHPARLEARVTDQEANQQWEGVCWYRKTFTLPAEAAGQVVRLRFEGAMNRAQAFVNGQLRGESIDGFTPFVIDLSDFAKAHAPITVALRLDNRHSEITGPKPLPILDFHLYHGLYRTVSLSIQPPLHITDEMFEDLPASGGIFVTYPEASDTAAKIDAKVHVRNAAERAAQFGLRAILRDLRGREVTRVERSGLTLEAGAADAFTVRLDVRQPRLWSPQAPNLYWLDVQVLAADQMIDSRRERIGIRRFELGPGGLTLNGRKLFLRGVNRHQEYPYAGNAVPGRAQYRDAFKIKQAGFDFIRVAHYPQSREFMDACDELGLVVLNAILGWQYNPGTPEFMANRLAAARALVRRDRNRPSSVLWELSLNETRMSSEFLAQLHAAGHEEYPGGQMATAGWMNGFDVKVTARQHGSTKEFLDAAFPSLVSEYGDWEYYAGNAGLNQEQWQDLAKAERNSRQRRGDGEVRLLQQATNLQEAHNENRSTKAFADGYWVMFDYNRGYAPDHEASGIMDIFRLPKFSYYFFQSQRDPEETLPGGVGGPMVFVATWWTNDSPRDVRVFSNCDEVELRLNGRSLGRRAPDQNRMTSHLPHPPFTFRIERFEAGELKAVGFRRGVPLAEHIVRTPGEPERIEVTLDLSGREFARGGDMVFAHARLVDGAGTVVPTANLPVTFEVDGDAQLIGENPIVAEAGIASVLVKSGHGGRELRLRARAEEFRGEVRAVLAEP
jgi:beta-galactosidase